MIIYFDIIDDQGLAHTLKRFTCKVLSEFNIDAEVVVKYTQDRAPDDNYWELGIDVSEDVAICLRLKYDAGGLEYLLRNESRKRYLKWLTTSRDQYKLLKHVKHVSITKI